MQIIAHRGGAGWRMENSLAAFAHAIELGAAGAELDVHLTRDGEMVVHHDDTLNPDYCRRGDGSWLAPDSALALADLRWAQLREFDISTPRPGSAYAQQHTRLTLEPGQGIPRLRDVIQLVQASSASFFLVIEIKTPMTCAASRPWRALVDATLAVIREHDFARRSVLCSFDWGALRYARTREPGIPTWFTSAPQSWFQPGQPPARDIPPPAAELRRLRAGHASGNPAWLAGFDPRAFDASLPRAVAAAGGNAWFAWHRDFTPASASELAALGLEGAVWTAGQLEPAKTRRLSAAGAGYAVVDYP